MRGDSLVLDDSGQVSVEQIILLTGVIGVIVVAVYVIKSQARNLAHVEKKAANETLNKSI